MSSLKEREEKICLNCQTELQGKYCHKCGQENVQPRRPIWEIPWHFINNIINVDGKFFTSVKYLLFRPGALSKEYVEGKRNKYHEPVRMYLFTSFIFFIVTSYVFSTIRKEVNENMVQVTQSDSLLTDSLRNALAADTNVVDLEIDPVPPAFKKGNSPFVDTTQIKGQSLQLGKDFLDKYESNLPVILWISLPLFALLLKLLYIRRKIYYWDHAIFSLHLYSFNFILISFSYFLYRILSLVLSGSALDTFIDINSGIMLLISSVYVYIGLKTFYRQSYIKTFFKFIILSIMVMFMFLFEFIGFVLVVYRHLLFAN